MNWGILGLQDGMHYADMENLKKQFEEKIALNEAVKTQNFQQIAEKLKDHEDTILMLMEQIQRMSNILIKIKRAFAPDEPEVDEDPEHVEPQHEEEIIEPVERLQLELFENIKIANQHIIDPTYWKKFDDELKNTNKFGGCIKLSIKENNGLVDKISGQILKPVFNKYTKESNYENIDVTELEIVVVTTPSLIFGNRYDTKQFKFTSPSGNFTNRDLLELFCRMEKMTRNEAYPHLTPEKLELERNSLYVNSIKKNTFKKWYDYDSKTGIHTYHDTPTGMIEYKITQELPKI
jgi:hypothetical protein